MLSFNAHTYLSMLAFEMVWNCFSNPTQGVNMHFKLVRFQTHTTSAAYAVPQCLLDPVLSREPCCIWRSQVYKLLQRRGQFAVSSKNAVHHRMIDQPEKRSQK